MRPVIHLVEHVLAMKDDAYLIGHPEWPEIVMDAIKVRDAMFDEAMDADAPLDADDRRQMQHVEQYVTAGVGRHEGHDVVFVSSDGTLPCFVYNHYYQPAPHIVYEKGDLFTIATMYAKEHLFSGELPFDDIYHILEISGDGWGLFQYVSNPPDQEYWKLVDSYDAIEAQERRMSGVAHANRIGPRGLVL